MEFVNKRPLTDLKGHVAGMRFYCFYCNHLSYSNSDLNHHLVQKHSIFPFKCQLCDYGALRRDSVMQHVRQMHSLPANATPLNLKRKHRGVSSDLTSPRLNNASTTSASQFASTTVSCSKTAAKKGDKVGLGSETVRANISPKVQTGLLATLSEQIENNKPLTVSVPNEVTIPVGCFVELIEVKTVNGKKELKLRRVPQQSECTTSKNAATIMSSLAPNATQTGENPGNDRTLTANRLTLKRNNWNQPHIARNGTELGQQSECVQTNLKDDHREINSKGHQILPQKNIQPPEIKQEVVKEEDFASCPKTQHLTQGSCSSSNIKLETNTHPSDLSVPADPAPSKHLKMEKTDSKSLLCKETVGSGEHSLEDKLSEQEAFPVISCVFSLSRQSEDIHGCSQPLLMALQKIAMGDADVPSVKTSSVYENQALASGTRQEENMKTGNSYNNVETQDLSTVCEQKPSTQEGVQVVTEKTMGPYKHIETQTVKHFPVKDERPSVIIMDSKEYAQKQCLSTGVIKNTAPTSTELSLSSLHETTPKGTLHTDVFVADSVSGSVPHPITDKSHTCPRLSEYLTISLKRIRLDEEETPNQPSDEKEHIKLRFRRRKKRKLEKASSFKRLTHVLDTSGHFISLKADQLVKWPGPAQPVVVLNHPKPKQPALWRKTESVDSKVHPVCHILKMKLSRVRGQKYEVMGCTVRICPQGRGEKGT